MNEKFKIMYYDNECGYIEYNKLNNEFQAHLYDNAEHVPFLLFGFGNETFADDKQVRAYIDGVVIPKTRENINDILEELGLDYYNQWEIYKKLEGKNVNDEFWIKSF